MATIADRPWTPEEDAILRARYFEDGARVLGEQLGRTWLSVYARTRRIGVPLRKRPWTAVDVARLQMLWETTLPLPAIAAKLGRSKKTVYWKAQQLALPLGHPDGYEYLTAAADRTGYETTQLRRILAAEGVRLYTVRARPEGKRSRHQHYVDGFDVDEAVGRWLDKETVESAARRLGLVSETLRRWLCDAGHKPPTTSRAHWRLPSKVIDGVVAERRAKLSLRQAAAACGVCEATLARALVNAGLPRPPRKLWLVRLDDAHRSLAAAPPKRPTRTVLASRRREAA